MKTELKIERMINLLKSQNFIQKELLSFREGRAYLDVSESFLYKLTASNGITFFKPSGKLIYFKKSDLDKWILQNEFLNAKSLELDVEKHLKKNA